MFWFGKKDPETSDDKKKVKFIRASTPKNTKIPQALEESKKIAKKLNEKFNLNFQVFMQRYGQMPVNTLYWIADFESIEQLHQIIEVDVAKDLELMAMLEILGAHIVDGSNYDTVLFDMD